jgi:hypothetical protein
MPRYFFLAGGAGGGYPWYGVWYGPGGGYAAVW